MKKRRDNVAEFTIRLDSKSKVVITLSMIDDAIPELCADLFLLKEGLVSSVVLTDAKSTYVLELSLGEKKYTQAVLTLKNKGASLKLSHPSFDALIYLFLEYYRDGISTSGHMDIIGTVSGDNRSAYVTFWLSRIIAGMTFEEAQQKGLFDDTFN